MTGTNTGTNTGTITVHETGTPLEFSVEDANRYHGPGFPGGVAHGFCVLQHAVHLLSDGGSKAIERREVSIRTAFPGPGGRDAAELILRSVTDGRYVVDPDLAEPERGHVLARYVWEFTYRGRSSACICATAVSSPTSSSRSAPGRTGPLRRMPTSTTSRSRWRSVSSPAR